MRPLLLCAGLLLGCLQWGSTQALQLQFQLIDEATQQPISDAHAFISDSSLGTTSDSDGYCELRVDQEETQVLIITHISYETLVMGPEGYRQLVNGAELRLKNNGIDLSEIELTASRGAQWKKNFRKFSKALLGEGKPAANCTILNPEVLRFAEEGGVFRTTAIDLLEIKNDYLAYDIKFWLEELTVSQDGSTFFKGNGQFIDRAEANDKKMTKRRERVYRHSLLHFLRSMASSNDPASLKDYGYELSIQQYEDGVFKTYFLPQPQDLVQADTTAGWFRLVFPEFLTVQHIGLRAETGRELQIPVSSAEQQKFGTSRTQAMGISTQFAISRLYKIAPYLLFDQRGNIINKSQFEEYGYWADQRLSATLPVDYQSSFSEMQNEEEAVVDTLAILQQFIGYDYEQKTDALAFLQNNWSPTYIPPLLDILRLSEDTWQRASIEKLLETRAPEVEANYFDGIQWLWAQEPVYGSYYADFKAYLYSALDPIFYQYFYQRAAQANIRLDEIVWGGVRQDGIPPLRNPKMLPAPEAQYLADTDVVFAAVIEGQAVAYPKRILAWHEFFTDEIQGKSVAGVYCTLCGTLILYNTEYAGTKHQLGTSGFLYRSNKLMYDAATQSLWSTILGQPVLGPLANQDIELEVLPVETTTWGEWRKRQPKTKVLSLETGHSRNYAEGEAYKEYYATDELMFPVPQQDRRLPNKARVFIPRTGDYAAAPLAISVDYLQRKRLHQDQIEDQRVLILSENNGASRAYAIGDHQFNSYRRGVLTDQNDQEWEVSEEVLIGPNGIRLNRLPAHEAFWFAWNNAFPQTRLIH